MFRNILVPIDGSAASMRALDSAIELAEGMNASLVVMTVLAMKPPWAGGPAAGATYVFEEATRAHTKEREQLLRDAMAKVPDTVACRKVLTTGDADKEIVAQLEQGDYDLVVLGTRGLKGMSATVLGSVSKHVVRDTATPVMLVRATDEDHDWVPPEQTVVADLED